jgi:hypothetical protein
MEAIKATLPPVRGVIQAALWLKDTVFDRPTYTEHQSILSPKVAGTYNLATSSAPPVQGGLAMSTTPDEAWMIIPR